MIVNIVHVYVKPSFLTEFIEITHENHMGTIKEPGNLRFDVLQDADDPTKFTLYEAFTSEDAAKEHKNTEHYLKWRETVADWMARPRQGIKHHVLYPENVEQW